MVLLTKCNTRKRRHNNLPTLLLETNAATEGAARYPKEVKAWLENYERVNGPLCGVSGSQCQGTSCDKRGFGSNSVRMTCPWRWFGGFTVANAGSHSDAGQLFLFQRNGLSWRRRVSGWKAVKGGVL